MNAFITLAYRQLKRFTRARSRVIGSFVNPIIWLVFFGLGWSQVFNFPMARQIFGGVDYLSFLAPGIVAMTIFNSSFISGISVIWDKQFGFLKEILVAPASRKAAIVGRIVGDSLTSLFQGTIILLLTFMIADSLTVSGIPFVLLIGFMLAVAFESFGGSLALRMTRMEGFQMIMSFLMLPLLYLSGAFYPIDTMPNWMQVLAHINPLTYAVDGSRYFLLGTSKFSITTDLSVLALLSIALLGIAMYSFERATIE